MTRTLGDIDMHRYGCVSEPQVHSFRLDKDDSAVILATDGLWDLNAVSSRDLVQMASRRRGRNARHLCEDLMDAVGNVGGPLDDCTVVCLTLR